MFLFSSRRRHTRCALVTGVQTCALPICMAMADPALMRTGSDWPAYGGSYSARRYSPLAQITPANVGKLERAWLIHTGDMPSKAAHGTYGAENTPLTCGDSLDVCTPKKIILAPDHAAGRQRSSSTPQDSDDGLPTTAHRRGAS